MFNIAFRKSSVYCGGFPSTSGGVYGGGSGHDRPGVQWLFQPQYGRCEALRDAAVRRLEPGSEPQRGYVQVKITNTIKIYHQIENIPVSKIMKIRHTRILPKYTKKCYEHNNKLKVSKRVTAVDHGTVSTWI